MIQAPSLTSFVALVIIIAGSGVVFDKLVLSSRLEPWRRSIGKLWIKLNTPGAQDLAQDANQLYCDLFDYIYGKRAFTWRRVWASILSSMIGLVVITLILGYENTFFGHEVKFLSDPESSPVWWWWWFVFSFVLISPMILNLIPDFFSLIETRLILNWSKVRGLLGIVLLIILDLVLTTAIFMVGMFLLAVFNSLYLYKGLVPRYLIFEVFGWESIVQDTWRAYVDIIKGMVDPRWYLVFYLTTFVTSLFWILFTLTFGLIWVFHRLSPLANLVYYQIGQSDRPAAALSAFLNGIIIIIYAVWRVLEWAIVS